MSLPAELALRLRRNRISRRDAMWLFGAGTTVLAAPLLQGCASSPVTGRTIVVGMSEDEERRVDAQQAPHQFSQDLGPVQDAQLNDYVGEVGRRLQAQVQRPQLPYSWRVLNANYVNAYTFPAGAVGVTRGIVTELHNEAQLAALLGHELGHVNARHAAQRQGKALIAQSALLGLQLASGDSGWAPLIGLGGQIGASALLANYSRQDEREADALGQDYLVRAGYPAGGMTALHQTLVDHERLQPSLLETMFSSHPMSTERRDAARWRAEGDYAASARLSPQRERFMDRTASLRRLRPTIEACKLGETAMARKAPQAAQSHFANALRLTPQDYAANLRMAQCLQAQGRTHEAQRYAEAARSVYPQEAQAHKLAAVLSLSQREPARAHALLDHYDRLLPGDAGVVFLKGVTLEGMGRRHQAAQHYEAFLRQGSEGAAARFSAARLKEWGYLR
ncbi:M48 family metalloprotease [Caldimonas tepidiphila]|uniref:M48 family metalloprotease n=1 Tax=Caldimonas tepidiphila TaxID=2315841 RepID=UPI000E5B12B2|nr:M48 family metalloprotease [Caldimonas tepidiphila]